jgi:aminoglycoside phosphotransferase (APT) family kinase protein
MPVAATGVPDWASLAKWLRNSLPADRVEIIGQEKLAGGAIQQNWLLDLDIRGGPKAGRRRWVLRMDAPSSLPASHGRSEEFAILKAARQAGVIAPEPILHCADPECLGGPFFIAAWAPGTAQGRRIVRDSSLAQFGPHLARELGRQLAMLHEIRPPRPDLAFLGNPPKDPVLRRIARYRADLDVLAASDPVLEYGLNWLEDHRPQPGPLALCHSDFRTGNYLVNDGALTAILDWEFADWSDVNEDIGWFCAACWRFGRTENEAGGIAPRADFYRGYEETSGRRIEPEAIRYWEVMAHARWAVIARQQEQRHLSGREPSLEMALTGRMVPEIELGLLREIENVTRGAGHAS